MMIKKILFCLLLFFLFPFPAHAARYELIGQPSASLNEEFSVVLNLESDEKINVGEAVINFDPQYLEIISIGDSSSIFSFFASKMFDNEKGAIRIIGGLPSPGFSGKGKIIEFIFKTKKTGDTKITISPNSKILNNQNSSNVFEKPTSINIKIDKSKKTNPQTNGANSTKGQENILNQYSFRIIILSNILTFTLAMILNIVIVLKLKKS